MHIKSEAWEAENLFNSYFRGHILSSEPLSEPVIGSKGALDITTKKVDAESISETKTLQQAEHEIKERRNGYQKISTDAYYRTERRGLRDGGEGGGQKWLENEGEIDGAPYSEWNGKPDPGL